MREQYWNYQVNLKHKFYYYKYFLLLFNRVNTYSSCICTVLSLSCVAAWGIWKTYPILWSVLICISQVVQVIYPRLPYNDLLVSTKFMIPALDGLLLTMRHDWLAIDLYGYSDEKIHKLLQKYESQYRELVLQFFSASYLPEIKWCENKASEECKNYFLTTYSNFYQQEV